MGPALLDSSIYVQGIDQPVAERDGVQREVPQQALRWSRKENDAAGCAGAGAPLVSPGPVPLAAVNVEWDHFQGAMWPWLLWQCKWEKGVPTSQPYPGRFAKRWCEIDQESRFGVAMPWPGSVVDGRRGAVWPHRWPGHSIQSPRTHCPHLEITDVGPEADPAHVLQEHIQGVPCSPHHTKCCLPVPLQCPTVLLQPQGQHFCPMPTSHHPKPC